MGILSHSAECSFVEAASWRLWRDFGAKNAQKTSKTHVFVKKTSNFNAKMTRFRYFLIFARPVSSWPTRSLRHA